jgi:alpha-amylase/alpha-mannosidase (GH57 family)
MLPTRDYAKHNPLWTDLNTNYALEWTLTRPKSAILRVFPLINKFYG